MSCADLGGRMFCATPSRRSYHRRNEVSDKEESESESGDDPDIISQMNDRGSCENLKNSLAKVPRLIRTQTLPNGQKSCRNDPPVVGNGSFRSAVRHNPTDRFEYVKSATMLCDVSMSTDRDTNYDFMRQSFKEKLETFKKLETMHKQDQAKEAEFLKSLYSSRKPRKPLLPNSASGMEYSGEKNSHNDGKAAEVPIVHTVGDRSGKDSSIDRNNLSMRLRFESILKCLESSKSLSNYHLENMPKLSTSTKKLLLDCANSANPQNEKPSCSLGQTPRNHRREVFCRSISSNSHSFGASIELLSSGSSELLSKNEAPKSKQCSQEDDLFFDRQPLRAGQEFSLINAVDLSPWPRDRTTSFPKEEFSFNSQTTENENYAESTPSTSAGSVSNSWDHHALRFEDGTTARKPIPVVPQLKIRTIVEPVPEHLDDITSGNLNIIETARTKLNTIWQSVAESVFPVTSGENKNRASPDSSKKIRPKEDADIPIQLKSDQSEDRNFRVSAATERMYRQTFPAKQTRQEYTAADLRNMRHRVRNPMELYSASKLDQENKDMRIAIKELMDTVKEQRILLQHLESFNESLLTEVRGVMSAYR